MSAPRRVLLNVDAGELPDEPAALFALAHLAHVACGGHAGDADTMARTLERARAAGCLAGAHPSYPDRAGFGRRPLDLPLEALAAAVRAQCEALAGVAAAVGVSLVSVKAHGALYHAASGDLRVAEAFVAAARAILSPAVTFVGPRGSALARVAEGLGAPLWIEGFADRGYDGLGALLPRGAPGAVLADPAAAVAQARTLARAGCDTLCVHGDNPAAVPILSALRRAFP